MAITEIREQGSTGAVLRRFEDVAGPVSVRRISWGAVFAGTAVGLVCQLWLAMLGVAIGASTIDPLKEANPMSGIGTGSAIWLALTIIVASFIGGWVTGKLAGIPRRMESALHGATSWAAANIVNFLLISTVFGALIAGTASVAGNTAKAAGQAANAAGQAGGQGTINQAANTARQEGQQLLNRGQQAVQSGQAQQQARQIGQKASKVAAGTSWGIVALMFLGLCAGVGGAVVGTPTMPSYARRI
jgi:hypothetical protein